MRGGVSLAVWIGGAVAELDVLRRATRNGDGGLAATVPLPPDPSRGREETDKKLREDLRERRRVIYRDLLDLADIDHVEIDVLAGASAGGLNAVLYGTALANGRRIDDMRKVWEDLAELPSLLRQTAKRWSRLVPSLLRGDEYLYLALRKRLSILAEPLARHELPASDDPDGPKPAARYLTVALSATMLPKSDPNGVRELRERGADSGRASFSLSLRPTMAAKSVLSDLPQGGTLNPRWQSFLVDRLALAGRSTSSFPGAFEPARVPADQRNQGEIAYHRADRPRRWRRAGATPPDPMSRYRRGPLIAMPDMVDVFSAARPKDPPSSAAEPFGVVDGGVFDNIAVGRALAAIAHAPSEVHTRRWLIYLDPSPAKAPVPKFGSLRPPAFTTPRLMLSLARMRAASSTVRDDLEVLQQYNERAQARRASTDAFSRQLLDQVQGIAATGSVPDDAVRELARCLALPDGTTRFYDRHRAATDLPRLTRLLVRPQQTISGQIFRAKGFHPWSEESVGEVMIQLRQPLRSWYTDQHHRLFLDLTAVMHTADFLIAWIRTLERWQYEHRSAAVDNPGGPDSPGVRKRIKRVLYRVLFVATALRDIADHEMLTTPMDGTLSDRVATSLTKVHDRQAKFRISSTLHEYIDFDPDGQAIRTPQTSDALFYDAVAKYLNGSLENPDAVLGDSQQYPSVQQPANLYLWIRLTELFEALRDQSPMLSDLRPGEIDADEADRRWRDTPFYILKRYPELARPDRSKVEPEPALANLGLIFAGAGGLPDSTQMVQFDTFTADQFSPLYKRMARLGQAVTADWARSMLRGRMPDINRPWLDSRTKLAGNQLANFAGFLDRRWRNNDWMWGRADSAANTVSLLVRQVDARQLTRKPAVIAAANRLADRVNVRRREGWNPAEIRELGIAVTRQLQLNIMDELLMTAFGDDPPRRFVGRKRRELAELTTGQETPAVLPARRRSGLIVHVGLLLFRSMLPSPTGVRTFLMRVAAQAVRPLYVLALLLAMPARAVLLLSLVLAGSAISGFGGPGSASVRAAVVGGVALAGCLFLALRANTTGRRLGQAKEAVKVSQAQAGKRQLISADEPSASRAQQEAVDDAAKRAEAALDIVDAVRRRRRAAAVILPCLTLTAFIAGWLTWIRLSPWLSQGNWASFGGLVLAEGGVILVLWRIPDRRLRGRTGNRRPTQPWFIWFLAGCAIASAIAGRHLPEAIGAIKRSVGANALTAASGEQVAALVGAVLLCAMILMSTFDWMRLHWLPAAWIVSVGIYAGLLFVAESAGMPNTVFGDIVVAAVSYGISFSYFITVFCASRHPKGRSRQLKEPHYDAELSALGTGRAPRAGEPKRHS